MNLFSLFRILLILSLTNALQEESSGFLADFKRHVRGIEAEPENSTLASPDFITTTDNKTDTKKFAGLYRLVKSENFDAYMKALNIGFFLRIMGNTLKNLVEIVINGDQWSLKAYSAFKNKELHFKLWQEFEEETMDGRIVNCTFTLDKGKLVQYEKAMKADEKDSVIIRELIGDDQLVATLIVKDPNGQIMAKRFYSREH